MPSPHFDEKSFSFKNLSERIDKELQYLKIECIDVLQWLVRSTPINDIERLNIIEKQYDQINDSFLRLKKDGKVKSVFSFPYSVPFANKVINLEEVDGIISYLNKEERDFEHFANDHPFIAIRPLNAGRLINPKTADKDIKECLKFVGLHKNVLTQIVGINSLEHLNMLLKT